MNDNTPDEIRELLEKAGLTQRAAAKRLEISEREFRRMCAGSRPIPDVVVLALRDLARTHQELIRRSV